MPDWKVSKVQPATAGLELRVCKVSSFRYARLVHTASGKIIREYVSEPLEVAYRVLVSRIDVALGSFDWTLGTEDELVSRYGLGHIQHAVLSVTTK